MTSRPNPDPLAWGEMMRRLEPQEILNLFDEFGGAPVLTRSGALIALSCPDVDPKLETPGARNARLMEIRQVNLGRRMFCLTACPACAEVLEIEIDTFDFTTGAAPDRVTVNHGGYMLEFRLPTAQDIEAAARSPSPLAKLASSCGIGLPPELKVEDPELHRTMSEAFDAADPLGCIRIETSCPTCGTITQPVLDPADLIWREFASVARRLEDDIHVLARSYGWPEREILALPESRRRRYVERVLA